MVTLFAQASSEVVERSALSLVRETVLGAITIVAIGIAVWAVLTLKKVQDARVLDKDAQADRAEKSNEKDRDRSEKASAAITDLTTALRENTRSIDGQKAVLESIQRTLTTLFDWLKMWTGKSSGTMPAVRPRKED